MRWLRLTLRCADDPRKTRLIWMMATTSEVRLESEPIENLPVFPADEPTRAPVSIARALAREIRTLLARACERGCGRRVEDAIEAADHFQLLPGNRVKVRNDGPPGGILVEGDGIRLSYSYLALDPSRGWVYCAAYLSRDGAQMLHFELVADGRKHDLNSRAAALSDGGQVFFGTIHKDRKFIIFGDALDLAP